MGKGSTFISDLKSLFKAGVLIANVLPVFTGFWLALYFGNLEFSEYWEIFILVIAGSTMVMAGALLINNWYDVDIDTIMERTKNRPTVTGHIPLKVVLTLGILLSILGFILLFFTTIQAVFYSFIGWFTYVFLYTMWSKRRYTFNTIIGSVSGAVTPLMGWTAVDQELDVIPIVLFLILFIWQMPHTYAIAIRKFDEYKAAGVAMLPVVRGYRRTKVHMVFYILCLMPLSFFLDQLGAAFIIITTTLNIVWLGVSIYGFFVKNNLKWAYIQFLYSVNYLTILFLLAIVVTISF